MNKYSIFIAYAAMLVGCGENSSIKAEIKSHLTDPESARFGEITVANEFACATVNAKNKFGGYAGNTQTLLIRENNGWQMVYERDEAHQECVKFAKNRSKYLAAAKAQNEEYKKIRADANAAIEKLSKLPILEAQFQVNLAPDLGRKSETLLLSIIVKFENSDVAEVAKRNKQKIDNNLLMHISSKSPSDLKSENGKNDLSEEIKKEILTAIRDQINEESSKAAIAVIFPVFKISTEKD